MVVALVALFVAMGGAGYAALKLPKNSVGRQQIKANAVNSSKVANRSLLAGDFKAGQLPTGPRGLKGDPCLPSDPSCKGPKGDTGAQGPGTISLDGQFSNDNSVHEIIDRNGVRVEVGCDSGGAGNAMIVVSRDSVQREFNAWGGERVGSDIVAATLSLDGTAELALTRSTRAGSAQLDVTAYAALPGETRKFVHVDALVIRGSACDYRVLVTPPG